MLKRAMRIGALAVTGVVAGQIAHAALRELPSFEGLDPSGTFGDAANPLLRIVIVGDSTITAPGLADPDDAWPRLVARHLADRYHVELVSLAEGGAKTRDVLELQVPRAIGQVWDLAIVSVGSNDVLRLIPFWRLASRMDAIVEQLGAWSHQVVLFGVGDIGSIPRLPFPADRIASMAGHVADWAHRRSARRYGVAKVDQWRLTTAAFNSGDHMFAADLFHPSEIGHQAWAHALLPTLEDALAGVAAR
ncbi:MAG TPA: GDSL-type esterase/lipase family protein [Acidimicrobiia bacterium]|jgi:lysophospholipase L1-like esterase|nr:GDSL-type esterase/lipase family protein [Acidimicrobiia bacterium]